MAKGFDGASFGNLMKQAQDLQRRMAQVQEGLRARVVEGAAGGGMVKAQVNGKLELVALKIDPEVVDPKEVDMLQDLVIAAVGQATRKAQELAEQEMAKVTGGMVPPGMF